MGWRATGDERPVRRKRTRFGGMLRRARVRTAKPETHHIRCHGDEKKRYVGASSGWRWNGRKFMRDKQGYRRVRENTCRSQSLHSTVSFETA